MLMAIDAQDEMKTARFFLNDKERLCEYGSCYTALRVFPSQEQSLRLDFNDTKENLYI